MTVNDLGKARPDLRNPALATMSEFLLKTENRYSGIPTIRREMKEYGLPDPVFENKRNEFVVTLYNKQKAVTKEYIQPLVDAGKLTLTIPDKPKSKNQKYYSK